MTVMAGNTHLGFEPKMATSLDAIGQTATPENMRPKLGPLANVQYKPCMWRYLVRLSAAPTTGAVNIKLMAGETVIRSEALAINGVTVISNKSPVDMSQVAGETDLRVELDVTAAADAGISATVDSYIEVEQPLFQIGC
ncbi:hypothetical protein [Marinobacter sp.]|uniref:hypothetical protein n=1 Tax=Marinobacter sp. TaxID=50741 RepID=UPI0035C6630A